MSRFASWSWGSVSLRASAGSLRTFSRPCVATSAVQTTSLGRISMFEEENRSSWAQAAVPARRTSSRASGRARSARLLLEPDGQEPPAVVRTDVRAEFLHVGHPRRYHTPGGAAGIVDLLRAIALDIVDDLPPLLFAAGAPLELDHLGQLGVVDAGRVERVAGQQRRQVRIGVGGLGARGQQHLVEVARE